MYLHSKEKIFLQLGVPIMPMPKLFKTFTNYTCGCCKFSDKLNNMSTFGVCDNCGEENHSLTNLEWAEKEFNKQRIHPLNEEDMDELYQLSFQITLNTENLNSNGWIIH